MSSTTEAGKTLKWKGDPDVPYCVRGRPKFLQEQGLDCGSSGPSVHRMQRINIHCFDGLSRKFAYSIIDRNAVERGPKYAAVIVTAFDSVDNIMMGF